MGFVDLLPVADWRNESWVIVNASTLFGAWNNDDDTKYAKCPGSKGRGEVSFPIDTSSVPEGAVITSVTVFLRCRRTSSATYSVTVNILAADDEGRYTSRTFVPTQTETTFEVATYNRDPRNLPWDVHRVNQLRCRVFSVSKILDAIRCHKFFVRCNYHTRPTVVVTSPTGTVRTPSPTIGWTYTQADMDALKQTEIKVFTALSTQSPSFNADRSPAVYAGIVQGDVTSQILPTSINPDNYVVYVRSMSVFGAVSKWASKTFEVQGPAPAPPGNDNAGVHGVPGIGVAEVVGDSYQSAIHLTMRHASNLLSVQAADFETSTDPLEWVGTNCTPDRETVNVYTPGTGSQKVTTTVAGTVHVRTDFVECPPLTPITAVAQVRTAVTARTVNLTAEFFDSTYASLGTASVLATDTDSTATWKELKDSGVTPADTAYAQLHVEFIATALSEVHYIDRAGLMFGIDSAWSHGGHHSRNLLSAVVSTADVLPGASAGNTFSANNTASTVTRTATTGTGSHGLSRFLMTYIGLSPTIGFRATGTSFTTPTTGNDITLNKPAGVVDQDFMLAFVTTTVPSTPVITGWEVVNGTSAEANNGMYVMKRTAGAAEPSTWTGAFGVNSSRRSAVVVAYSGAANASEQFEAESVRADPDGASVHTTATVNNTAANAWRVGAFCARDDVGGGTMTANINPPSIPADPLFVGRGAKWASASTTSSFTVNRPANVKSGDFMVAEVSSNGSPNLSAFAGWTLVRRVNQSETFNSLTLFVFKRTAGSSEPSSWTGTFTSSQKPVLTSSVAYRNCKDASLQFLSGWETGNTDNSGSSIVTGILNNTSSKSLRMSVFAANFDEDNTWTSSEVVERSDDTQEHSGSSGYHVAMAVYDSGTPVSTGLHQRTGSTTDFYGAVSWIGLIAGLDTVPSPVADETERRDVTTGSSDPWQTLGIYDSNGGIGVGPTSLTATFTGASANSVLSWIGIIKPAAPVIAGDAAAKLTDVVDISKIDPIVFKLADNKISVTAAFLGSTAGVPYLTLDFYRANQLISSATAEGVSFGTSTWSKSGAVFDLPEGCTRVGMSISVRERAVSDTVSFDRVSIALGDSLVWRNGTGRAEHPVWSHPQIQYADDDGAGYGEWAMLPGLKLNPPEYDMFTGLVHFTDHTVVPLRRRKFRCRTLSYGLLGDKFVSEWGPETDEVSFTAQSWWIKDIKDPTQNLLLRVKSEITEITTKNTGTEVYTMGSDKAKVVGDGFKGDKFPITVIVTSEEHARLKRLIKSGRTVFIQSDVDEAWWCRLTGDMIAGIQLTSKRKEQPLRFVGLTYVEVDAEE